MHKPHATPIRYGSEERPPGSPLRSTLVPIVGGAALIVLFFVLLLSSPGTRKSATETEAAVADTRPAPAAPAPKATARTAGHRVDCAVPTAAGRAGVVARRYRGQPTSNGHRYDPEESACIVNAAGALGDLAYGIEIALLRADRPEQRTTCKVIGRWNGERFPDRLVLVSSATARELEVGEQGLVEVQSGCAATTTARAGAGGHDLG